jgi:hypothetical protein
LKIRREIAEKIAIFEKNLSQSPPQNHPYIILLLLLTMSLPLSRHPFFSGADKMRNFHFNGAGDTRRIMDDDLFHG